VSTSASGLKVLAMSVSFTTKGTVFKDALAGKFGTSIKDQALALKKKEDSLPTKNAQSRAKQLTAGLGEVHNMEQKLYSSIASYKGESGALSQAIKMEKSVAAGHAKALKNSPDALTAGDKTYLLHAAGVTTTVDTASAKHYGKSVKDRSATQHANAAVASGIAKDPAVKSKMAAYSAAVAGKDSNKITAALIALNKAELAAANKLPHSIEQANISKYLKDNPAAVTTTTGSVQLVNGKTGKIAGQSTVGLFAGDASAGANSGGLQSIVSSLKADSSVLLAYKAFNTAKASKDPAAIAKAVHRLNKAQLEVLQKNAPTGGAWTSFANTLFNNPNALMPLDGSSPNNLIQVDEKTGMAQFQLGTVLDTKL
jgi:hypothetical protein